MDINETEQGVTLTFSPEEYAEFRRTYAAAWFFIRDMVEKSVPSGRIFGKGDEPKQTLKQRIEALEDRLERSAGDDMAQPWEIWAEIQMDKFAAGMREMSEQGNADRDRLNNAMIRLSQLENRMNAYGMPVVAEMPMSRENIASLFGVSRHEDGHALGLDTAVLRVRRYMAGHFSEGTIGGVVQAIREGSDRAVPAQDVPDHAFRFASPDRRHCSYRKNHRGQPCGRLQSEHAQSGSD